MTKRKGKSQRRKKNWQQIYHSGKETGDFSRRQKVPIPAVKLPPWRLDRAEELDDLPRTEGMVVGMFPGGATVRVGRENLLCGIAGTFRAPQGATALAVGDVVTVAMTRIQPGDAAASDKDRADGMIVSRQPRNTALSRPRPRSGKRRDEHDAVFEKVIAANMDVLLIVAATRQPPLRHGIIDRFLIIAERGELKPILVINKIDLGVPDENVLADFRSLGIDIRPCSAITGEGLEALHAAIVDRRSVLAGASGVGKSTLINTMIPGADAPTREVRAKDDRGRHTTAGAVVYDLPGGGIIVDTPGIRELGLHLERGELPWYFPEFEAFSQQCRFNNCTHTHEPDCAVIAAVREGKVLSRRYQGYLRILETLG